RGHAHLQHLLPVSHLYGTTGLHDRYAGHHRPALAADRERGGEQLYAGDAQRVRAGAARGLVEPRCAAAVDLGCLLYQVAPGRLPVGGVTVLAAPDSAGFWTKHRAGLRAAAAAGRSVDI